MKTFILASGSKGNALVIEYKNDFILVDIGISYLSLKNKMIEQELNPNKINRLLITHEHSDHVKGLKTFLKQHPNVEIILTKKTFDVLTSDVKELINNKQIIKQDSNFNLNDINVVSYALSHDAAEPVGYVFSANNKKIVIATDTGYIDESYYNLLKNGDLYILEANHCPEMLMNSRRHFYLKQRILGTKGHLSNNDAAWLMNYFIKDKVYSKWAVAHISEDCNSIVKIEQAIVNLVDDPTKLEIIYTSQDSNEVIELW